MAIAKWPPPRLQEALEEVTPVAEALSDLSESSEVPIKTSRDWKRNQPGFWKMEPQMEPNESQ